MVVCISPRPPRATVTQTVTAIDDGHGHDHGQRHRHGHGHRQAVLDPDRQCDPHADAERIADADCHAYPHAYSHDHARRLRPTGTPGCASTSANVPDGSDGRGGCFPGVSNTGPSAPATSMADLHRVLHDHPTANVVIDSKVVNCRTLVVASGGGGLVLKNSYLNGGIVQSGGNCVVHGAGLVHRQRRHVPRVQQRQLPGREVRLRRPEQPDDPTAGVTGANFTIAAHRDHQLQPRLPTARSRNSPDPGTSYVVHGTNLWPTSSWPTPPSVCDACGTTRCTAPTPGRSSTARSAARRT